MGGHENGLAATRQAVQQAGYVHSALRVEIAGRLVGHQQPGPVEQGAGYGDALLFAAAQLVRILIAGVGQPHQPKHLCNALFPLGPAVPAGRPQHEVQVLLGRQLLQQLEVLEYDSEATAQLRHVAAPQGQHVEIQYLRTPGFLHAYLGIQTLQQGTLAAAHLAEQVNELALVHDEIEVPEHYALSLRQCRVLVIHYPIRHSCSFFWLSNSAAWAAKSSSGITAGSQCMVKPRRSMPRSQVICRLANWWMAVSSPRSMSARPICPITYRVTNLYSSP